MGLQPKTIKNQSDKQPAVNTAAKKVASKVINKSKISSSKKVIRAIE